MEAKMTTYALITADTIAATGNPPTGAQRLDTGAWVTPPPDGWTPALLAACGWHPVTEAPRPADTTEGTHDSSIALLDGLPVRVWTWRAWTSDELVAQAAAAQYEAQQAADRAALDTLATTASAAHADGETWTKPTGAHDAYPLGAAVTHGGKTWESLTPFCVWEPGVSGWRERVAEGYPAWVQPTGGHDAYPKGVRVTFEGADYESLIDGNVWSPTGYPAGWRKL